MKPFSILGAVALALAACAPARTAPPPAAPAPATAPAPAARPAPAPAPAPELDAAPEGWWLLDEEVGGVRGIGAERAYRELLAGREPEQSVVVAVIDSGIDIEHEDLDAVLWVNEDEVPGNRVDDDRNGYVDDIHGWNFIGGPGGEHVHRDTYEVARLFAQLRGRYEGARPDTLSVAARAEYDLFREVEAELREKRAETREQLEEMRQIDAIMDQIVALLQREIGSDSLTAERVAAIRSFRPDVLRAKQIFLELDAQGGTPAVIQEQVEALEGRLEYGLNPDFDPRPIVGDDYADPEERGYGNPDVEGPDAVHGTHVAGIIAAERGNDVGIDGIAPAVRIMVLRAVPDGDERDKDVANAIRYAVDNGADIINMSFGKGFSPQKDVVDAAVRYADERGVLLIHAAGNDAADLATEPSFPTRRYEGGGEPELWIEVGASSWEGAGKLAAPFSNYGAGEVDVFAPGVDILSAVPESRYERNSGTSMAAPVVTGLAALLMAYYPDLSAAEVRRIILESATPYAQEAVLLPGSDRDRVPFGALSRTGGVVNAYRAVRLAEELSGR